MPARDINALVEFVVEIPAEHDITKAEPVVDGAGELFAIDIFPAQDAVDIEDADLKEADPFGFDPCIELG